MVILFDSSLSGAHVTFQSQRHLTLMYDGLLYRQVMVDDRLFYTVEA